MNNFAEKKSTWKAVRACKMRKLSKKTTVPGFRLTRNSLLGSCANFENHSYALNQATNNHLASNATERSCFSPHPIVFFVFSFISLKFHPRFRFFLPVYGLSFTLCSAECNGLFSFIFQLHCWSNECWRIPILRKYHSHVLMQICFTIVAQYVFKSFSSTLSGNLTQEFLKSPLRSLIATYMKIRWVAAARPRKQLNLAYST